MNQNKFAIEEGVLESFLHIQLVQKVFFLFLKKILDTLIIQLHFCHFKGVFTRHSFGAFGHFLSPLVQVKLTQYMNTAITFTPKSGLVNFVTDCLKLQYYYD